MTIVSKDFEYFDYTATHRLYKPIEDYLVKEIYPIYYNSHSDGSSLSKFGKIVDYSVAEIKKMLGVGEDYDIYFVGSGATAAANMIGFLLKDEIKGREVYISEAEHNSVSALFGCDCGCKKLNILKLNELGAYNPDEIKDGSFVFLTCASNVFGTIQPWDSIKKGRKDTIVCVDGSAYISSHNVDLSKNKVDAFIFSGHKIHGGPGTTGVLVINKKYLPEKQYCPGGGTISSIYVENKYLKFDFNDEMVGGTRPNLQIIKLYLSLKLHYAQEFKEQKNAKIVDLVNKTLFANKIVPYRGYISNKVPIFSFVHNSGAKISLGEFLEKNGVFIRKKSRLCAYLLEEKQVFWDRISFSYINSLDEVKKILKLIIDYHNNYV